METGVIKADSINLIGNPAAPSIYSNISFVTFTPEEFVLVFSERDPTNVSVAREVARIYLSVPHAKRVANVMAGSVEKYEQMFGEIVTDLLAAHPELIGDATKTQE